MDENLKNQKEEMVDRIKEEFKDDPLFIECSLNHLTKGQLFPDFLGEISPILEYSISDITEYVNRSDSNIRYYLGSVPNYIGAVKTSASYRLKYDNIYRIYLITLYIKDLNKQMADIRVKTGEEAQVIPTKRKNKKSKLDEEILENLLINIHLDNIQKTTNESKLFLGIIEYIREKEELLKKEKEYNQQYLTLKLLENKKEELNKELGFTVIKVKESLIQQKLFELQNQKMKNAGFFARLKSIVVNSDEIETPTDEEIQTHPAIRDLLDYRKDIEEKIEQENKVTNQIEKEIKELEEKVDKLQKEIYEKHQISQDAAKHSINESIVQMSLLKNMSEKDLSDALSIGSLKEVAATEETDTE